MVSVWSLLVYVAAAGAGLCWLATFLCWLGMLRNLNGRRSVGYLLFHGLAAFDPENYTERGQLWQRRFVRCFVGFFVAILAVAAAAALTMKR